MQKDKDIKDELKKLSPLLSEMKAKADRPQPPENYFHYLESSIMEQVATEPTPTVQTAGGVRISLWQRVFSPFGAAGLASVLLLAGAALFFIKKGDAPTTAGLQFAELTDAEIMDYLYESAEDLDIYSFELSEENETFLDFNEINSGEAEDYLLNLSTETLEEEIF